MPSADIVIIGSGIIGSSTAYYLAKAGADIILVDRAGPNSGGTASQACAGGVRQQGRIAAEIPLAIHAIGLWAGLEAELQTDLHYRRDGMTVMTDNENLIPVLQKRVIEEKALGNLEKIGRTSQYIDAMGPAEAPTKGPGLYFMDSSSAAAECVTLMAAGGAVIHTFPTGQGNVVGNPIVPVIKISGNPRTLRTMAEHIDVDVTGVLTREQTIDQAGDALIEMIIRTANGRHTAAEALGHVEFSMTKLYRSA